MKQCVLGIVLVAATGCTHSTEPTEPPLELRLEALTDTSLTGTVGMEVTPAPTVRVTNRAGSPIPGIAISFEVTGGGTITNPSVRTDSGGLATVGTWRLGAAVGAYTVTASSRGLAAVVFTALGEPGPFAEITQVSGNYQTALPGAVLSKPLQVRAADRFGNAVSRVSVTFAVISGNGTIDASTAVTDSVGIATSGVWTLGPAPGTQQVRAQAGSVQAVFTAFACETSCQAELAFVRDGRIFVTNLVGAEWQLAVDGSGWDAEPTWSPDGRRIAFVRHDRGYPGDIYVMDADGSIAVRRAAGFDSPAWSPDGRVLAVVRPTSGDLCVYDCEIYLLSVDEDSTGPEQVAAMAAWPAWSPDGTKIAFVSLSGDDGYHALHVMNADGSGDTAITLRDEGGINHPTWSPDGRRIAFSKCINGACNIFAVNADGSALVQLTTVPNAFEPAWSPDGTRIAFTFRPKAGGESVAYVDADGGGEPIPVVSYGRSPAWRPGPQGQ